jgi:hypothetical protein
VAAPIPEAAGYGGILVNFSIPLSCRSSFDLPILAVLTSFCCQGDCFRSLGKRIELSDCRERLQVELFSEIDLTKRYREEKPSLSLSCRKVSSQFSEMGMGGGWLRSKALSFLSDFGRSETLRISQFTSIFALIPKLRVEHGLGAIY